MGNFTDLTEFLDPGLTLKAGPHTYDVALPDSDLGLSLAAVAAKASAVYQEVAIGDVCPTCSHPLGSSQMAPEFTERVEHLSATGARLEVMIFGRPTFDGGPTVLEQMHADRLPEAHIDLMARYAMNYFIYGPDVANATLRAAKEGAAGPKAPRSGTTSRSGRSTASGSRTRTASTRTTRSRTTAAPDGLPTTTEGSPGETSSPTGP